MRSNKEIDCGWQLIYERLKELASWIVLNVRRIPRIGRRVEMATAQVIKEVSQA